MSASCKTTWRSIQCTHIRAECLSTRPFPSLFLSKGCLSRLLKFFIFTHHSLWLGFLPHKINTRINTHSNAKERRAKERRRRPTIAESGFSIYPLVVRRHHPHQSPVSKTTFLNLFSLRRRENNGRQNKKEFNEEGRRFSSASSCLLLRRARNKSCEKRSTL